MFITMDDIFVHVRIMLNLLAWFYGLLTFNMLLFLFQRHNAMEHGGRMSRAQRNAALQACIIFIFFLSFPYTLEIIQHACCYILVSNKSSLFALSIL